MSAAASLARRLGLRPPVAGRPRPDLLQESEELALTADVARRTAFGPCAGTDSRPAGGGETDLIRDPYGPDERVFGPAGMRQGWPFGGVVRWCGCGCGQAAPGACWNCGAQP